MATVQFTRHLNRYFPELAETELEAPTVAALIARLDQQHPGLAGYLVDEHGSLRHHVNVFIDGEMVRDRLRLTDTLTPAATVYVMQALSGG